MLKLFCGLRNMTFFGEALTSECFLERWLISQCFSHPHHQERPCRSAPSLPGAVNKGGRRRATWPRLAATSAVTLARLSTGARVGSQARSLKLATEEYLSGPVTRADI